MTNTFNPKSVGAVVQILQDITLLPRWTSLINDLRYNELSKQCLNAIVSYWIASKYEEETSEILDFSAFPKFALYRIFEKSIRCDIQQETMEEYSKYGIGLNTFSEYTQSKIVFLTSQEFLDFISIKQNSLENVIYKLATKIATYIEVLELEQHLSVTDFDKKKNEILADIQKLSKTNLRISVKNFITKGSIEQNILLATAKLRNRIRWVKHCSLVPCSVLGHMFETGILAYINAMHSGYTDSIATKMYFIGCFHDWPETWTGDMPSPLKDAIPGLRKATEEYEIAMLKKHVYDLLPQYLVKAFQDVMLENEELISYKNIIKQADYISAMLECKKQIIAGSHDAYFLQAIQQYYSQKEDYTFLMRNLAEEIHTDVISLSK